MRFSSIATGVALLALLIGLAGCGSSVVGSSTSAGEPAYIQELTDLNEEFEGGPAATQMDAALENDNATLLPQLEKAIKAYVAESAEYSAKIRQLDFPSCARPLQLERLHIEAEARHVFAGALPLIRTGNVIRVASYMDRALEPVEARQRAFDARLDKVLGNDGC